MLSKTEITDMSQLDQLAESASSIVIYGSKTPGRLVADYLISAGKAGKLSGIVHTYTSRNYDNSYREVAICSASEFFEIPGNRDSLVIVSVKNPMSRAEIFESLESYGIGSCVYLDKAGTSLLSQIVCLENVAIQEEYDMVSCVFTECQLLGIVKKANKVVIYGTKRNKDMMEKYLEMTGCRPQALKSIEVIQEKAGGAYKAVAPFAGGDPEYEDAVILVAADPFNPNYKVPWEMEGFDTKKFHYCTDELMERIFILLKNGKEEVSVQEPRFLVAGFPKSGSTSLHYVLQDIKDVYVPDSKESQYLFHRDSEADPKAKLLHSFFGRVPQNQIPGCVDPIFALYAEQAWETFGPDLKVGFVMRNPVHATYSYFKMWNRFGDSSCRCHYDKYKGYCDEMLDDYISGLSEDRRQYFDYASALEGFLRYYPSEQIHVIILEELVRDPGQIVNDFLRFIGSAEIYDARQGFKKENSGDYVWADEKGWKLGMKSSELRDEKETCLKWRLLDDPEAALARANELENELFRIGRLCEAAEKIYNPKMTLEQQKHLEDFYRPSVRKLERMLDKDLSKLWFK